MNTLKNKEEQKNTQIDIRRENQMMSGYKKVGFAEDVPNEGNKTLTRTLENENRLMKKST